MSSPSSSEPIRFAGRRRGRSLRPHRQALLDTALARYAIPPGDAPLDLFALFAPARPQALWLEIGFGAGEHLLAQAEAHPDVGMIGCEPFLNGVAALLASLDKRDQDTTAIRIWPDEARPLLQRLPEACVARCFVLFPDPWPKTRHHKRRLINPETLDQLARLLIDGGELRLASDHAGYIAWMLQHTLAHPALEWRADSARDWLERPADQPPTRYERKALAGRPHYLRFRRRHRTGAQTNNRPIAPR